MLLCIKRNQCPTRIDQHKTTVEGYERLHVQVTQQQYRHLKRIAYERNISLAEVVRQAVGSWLESQ